LRAFFCCGGASAVADDIWRRGYRRLVARRSVPPARQCAFLAALPAVRRCAARRSDGLARGRGPTPAGTAAAAVADAAPLSPPDAPPTTATWLYVPPCALAAKEPAGVPGVNASPSAPPP